MSEEQQKSEIKTTFDTAECTSLISDIIKALQNSPTKSRERALAVTKLQEAAMWLASERATEARTR